MIKRIVSLFIVVCLLLSLFCVTASAADIYEIDKSVALMSTSPLSVSDSGISTAAVEPDDLAEYLSYKSQTVAQWLQLIAYAITGNQYGSYYGNSIASMLLSIVEGIDDLEGILSYSDTYLSSNGNESLANTDNIGSYIRNGFLGLSNNIKTVGSNLQSELVNILNRVGDVVSGLSVVNSSIGTVNTSVNTVDSSVNSMSGKLSGSAGVSYLGVTGQPITYSVGLSLANINRMGFVGLGSHFRAASGSDVLLSNGTPGQAPSDVTYSYLFRYGLLGLRSLLSGSETDNVYSFTLNDNNNTTTTVNSTGLGPLLNTHLSNIGENLGHLAYIFASDDDIKLKQDSKPLVDATDSFFDDSDTKVKVSADNIGSLKNVAGDFLDIVDTGADVGDAVSIVTNANSFRWFTAQTAADLDSIGTATVSDEESTYDRLHREFNEIYFPDRVGGGN